MTLRTSPKSHPRSSGPSVPLPEICQNERMKNGGCVWALANHEFLLVRDTTNDQWQWNFWISTYFVRHSVNLERLIFIRIAAWYLFLWPRGHACLLSMRRYASANTHIIKRASGMRLPQRWGKVRRFSIVRSTKNHQSLKACSALRESCEIF